jgi:hypothetical protein
MRNWRKISLTLFDNLARRFCPSWPPAMPPKPCDAADPVNVRKSVFIAELQPFAARLSPLQLRAILSQVHSLTLRRSA